MTAYLFDNTVGPPGVNGGFLVSFELGMGFSVATDCQLTHWRWYATTTTTTDKPSNATLWNLNTGQSIWSTSTVPHSGSVGWQTTTLGTPFNLYAGGEYIFSVGLPAGPHIGSIGAISVPPSPLIYANLGKGLQTGNNGQGTMPTSVSTVAWWIDVGVDAGTQPPSGGATVTVEQLNAKLDSWFLDTGDNTHQTDGVPYETWTLATAIKGVTDRVDALTDPAISWLNDRSSQLTDFLNGVNAGAVAALNDLASRITGSGAGGGSAFYSGDSRQVAQTAADTYDVTALLLALRRNALVDFPGAPWVMTDETAFDTDVAYTEEADLYVVTFTDLGGNIVNTVAAGVDVSYRLAWWAPLIGAFAQQRRFIDTPSAHLWLDGTRLPGVLLHSPAGAAGTIQAWTYA